MNSASQEKVNIDDFSQSNSRDFLTIKIANQIFGIPVLQVQDVLGTQNITKIPLAPAEVAGSLNLRGRIVTAINVRCSLGIEANEDTKQEMSVVVEHEDQLYSLIIDEVGDVLALESDDFENTPATLDPIWRNVASGIFQLKGELLVILDIAKLIDTVSK